MRERGRDIEEAARGRAAWAPFLHSWPGDNQRTEPDPSPSPSCTRGPDPSPSPSPDAPALPESIDEATLEIIVAPRYATDYAVRSNHIQYRRDVQDVVDIIVYQICDTNGRCERATVTVTVPN